MPCCTPSVALNRKIQPKFRSSLRRRRLSISSVVNRTSHPPSAPHCSDTFLVYVPEVGSAILHVHRRLVGVRRSVTSRRTCSTSSEITKPVRGFRLLCHFPSICVPLLALAFHLVRSHSIQSIVVHSQYYAHVLYFAITNDKLQYESPTRGGQSVTVK